ncbi:MAG: protease modulator HflC [Gammaproteobacteria bacterium]|jgi:membrane protease subunit HflC
MNRWRNVGIALIVLAIIGFFLSTFMVNERQLAVKFRFGQILRSDYQPGLHFKWPFVDRVRKFDGRILTLDNRPEQFLTVDKNYVMVDFFVKYQISDVDTYYRATGGHDSNAQQRLLEIIKNGLRSEFASRTVPEVVTAERSDIMDTMTVNANKAARQLGVTIVDVRVKRIDLPDKVSESVFQRMRTERERIAAQKRAEGKERAEEIRSKADRERTVIVADARQKSEKLRGEGDAQATNIYAKAYQQDPEFFDFYRSLQAYRKGLGNDNNVLVISPDSDFFRYFHKEGRGRR